MRAPFYHWSTSEYSGQVRTWTFIAWVSVKIPNQLEDMPIIAEEARIELTTTCFGDKGSTYWTTPQFAESVGLEPTT